MFNTKIFEQSNTPSINIIGDNVGNASGNGSSNAQPIDITHQQRHHSIINNSKFRRESIAHSQGMGGVSWGSVTIGSWLKDEVMMASHGSHLGGVGQSHLSNNNNHHHHHHHHHRPSQSHVGSHEITNTTHSINLQSMKKQNYKQNPLISISPPHHTSYLPDLESEYCKDYSCCGELLPTLHDLLRHYEEAHISPSPPPENHHQIIDQNRNRNLNMHNMLETVSTTDVFLNNSNNITTNTNNNNNNNTNNNTNISHSNTNSHNQINSNQFSGNPQQFQQQANQQSHSQQHLLQQSYQSNQQQSRQQQNSQQHQNNYNHQQSINNNFTSNQFNFNNNTTNQVPTSIQPQQLPIHSQLHQSHQQTNRSGANNEDTMYIDDPARHLYVMENDEHKPFKCPVIGCEKTYKNQNGLKYHRIHGHQNQKLKENSDGTISIIDPESNTPYLDGQGMEKDKPYRCEVCGKRYKNLNGLKYHRGHTTH